MYKFNCKEMIFLNGDFNIAFMIVENNNTYVLEDCLIIPVAAKSIHSIKKYVGSITEKSKDDKWCYVDFTPRFQKLRNQPDSSLDTSATAETRCPN
jgi:hypothetical protein